MNDETQILIKLQSDLSLLSGGLKEFREETSRRLLNLETKIATGFKERIALTVSIISCVTGVTACMMKFF